MNPPGSVLDARAAAYGASNKREYVRAMFSSIAPRYDLLNHVLSLNVDRAWRRAAVNALDIGRKPHGTYLDLCAGTLDLARGIADSPAFRGSVVGVDFAEPMLRAGRHKLNGVPGGPVGGDALDLPVASNSAAGAVVGFGIRNVADLDRALTEVHRVLERGARFVILEFSTPRLPVVGTLYRAYFHHVLPRIGRLVSGHPTAYRYLPESVDRFPECEALAARLTAAGFSDVRWRRLTLGIAALHVGVKR